jgi:CrcB protein
MTPAWHFSRRIFFIRKVEAMFEKLLYLGAAGAAGTIARCWLADTLERNFPLQMPLGTAAVNIAGCLFFGLLWAAMEGRLAAAAHARTFIFLGFFGAFTTFSSFAFETSRMLDESRWLAAAANILLHNGAGIAGLIAGLALGKWFVP